MNISILAQFIINHSSCSENCQTLFFYSISIKHNISILEKKKKENDDPCYWFCNVGSRACYSNELDVITPKLENISK